MSRSKFLERMIKENDDQSKTTLYLYDLPGGAGSFLLIAKFCYDVKFELTATNVVSLRCAADYLQMTEDYGEGNLVSLTSTFLEQVLTGWEQTVQALETCEGVLPFSEELHIIEKCIDSLASKACDDRAFAGQPANQSPSTPAVWNGIPSASEPCSPAEDRWYDDVAVLHLPLFKRLINAVAMKGMAPSRISAALTLYAKRHLPLHGRRSSFCERNHESVHSLSEEEQRNLIEEITELLPEEKGATPTKFLLKLLKFSLILDASSSCRETLERRIGAQLDQANLQDLLIPNTVPSEETVYDVECVQRIVDHFLDIVQDDDYEGEEERSVVEGFDSPPALTVVANLVDGYLAEVASDVNLKLEDFVLLAASLPEYARSLDDGIYHAIDIFIKVTFVSTFVFLLGN